VAGLHRTFGSCGALILLAGLTNAYAVAQDESKNDELSRISAIEAKTLEARQAYRSGIFRVTRYLHDIGLKKTWNDTIITYIDDAKIREDYISEDRIRIHCFADPIFMELNYDPRQLASADRSRWPAVIKRNLKDINPLDPEYATFKPKYLMFNSASYELAKGFHLNMFVGAPARDELSLLDAQYQGNQAYIIKFRMTATGVRFEYTVVPSFGYSIVKFYSHINGQYGNVEAVSTCTLQQVGEGVWFPASEETKHYCNKEIIREETLTISSDQINKPLEPAIFTLRGLDLRPNILIADKTTPKAERNLEIWDGTRVRAVTARDHAEIQISRSKPVKSAARQISLWVSAICVFVSVALYLRAWNKRRQLRC
jgi:hypothetical protein